MPTTVNIIIIAIALALWVLLILRLVFKTLKNRKAPVKTVKAVVVERRKDEQFSKYSGKSVKYLIVFSAEGKKLSFYVSEFSWHQYQNQRSGTLKYQGDRLIDFS